MDNVYVWCGHCGEFVWAIRERCPVYKCYCPQCGTTDEVTIQKIYGDKPTIEEKQNDN